jgi:hypothetical protein
MPEVEEYLQAIATPILRIVGRFEYLALAEETFLNIQHIQFKLANLRE